MEDDIRWVKTHCARMDHGGCALVVGVQGNRIIKVQGDPDGFLNKGYICHKGRASPDRLNHPSRLRHPLKRCGDRGEGRWQKISWTEAIQTIRLNLKRVQNKYGARAVAFCQGMPKGLEHFVLIRLANTFGSPNVVTVQDVCHAPREIGGMHTCGFYPVADFRHPCKLVTLWGSNLNSTNEEGQICSQLAELFKQGTALMVVDPKKTQLAQKARLHLQIKPGTDNALALAFLNVIIAENIYDDEFVANFTHGFEDLSTHVRGYSPQRMADLTGVPADQIREGARLYATSHPAALQWGNAIEQNRHTFDTVRALVSLMAICGNLDVPGGNIQANDPEILSLGKFVRADLLPSKRKEMISAYHHTIPRLMTIPPSFFKKAVLAEIPYPVKAAYMQCTNPLVGYADSRQTYNALMKLDFLAVADIFMTPTASLADIVLPAASQFEFNDIGHYGLGHGYILARPKIVEPPAECWPDVKILNELGKSLTPKEFWYEDYEQLLEEVLAPGGLSYDQFVGQGYLKGPSRFKKYLTSGFKTPTAKVELSLSTAQKFNLPPLPRVNELPAAADTEYPLILTCAKDRYYLHSAYRWIERLRQRRPRPEAQVHPETAARYNVQDGDELLIETRTGAITQFAQVTDKVLKGVVYAAYGWWFAKGEEGETRIDWKKSNYNMLTTTEKLGREFGTPNLKGIHCRVRRK